MFGVKKRVERVRAALVQAFQKKSFEIMMLHADKPPEQIPKTDLMRSMILKDIADILAGLHVEESDGHPPHDDKAG